MNWQDLAACRNSSSALFFPESHSQSQNKRLAAHARTVCRGCPVARECHDFAQTSNRGNREEWGIWAGVDYGAKKRPKPAWKLVELSRRESVA